MRAELISFCLGTFLSTFAVKLDFGGKEAKNKIYRMPLLRTKRDLHDKQGIPTENLKGRPGQGYYIAANLGTPPQRVSSREFSWKLGKCKVHDT